jgi:hypothetical protein
MWSTVVPVTAGMRPSCWSVCPLRQGYVKLKRDGHQGWHAGGGEDAQPGPTPNGAAKRPSLRSAVPRPMPRVCGFVEVWQRSNPVGPVTPRRVTCLPCARIDSRRPDRAGQHAPQWTTTTTTATTAPNDTPPACDSACLRARRDPAGASACYSRPARGVFWTLGRVKQIVHRCTLKRPVQHISRPPHLCPSRTHNPPSPALDDVTRPGSPESLIALSLLPPHLANHMPARLTRP